MPLTYVASLPLYLLAPSVWLSVGNVSVGLNASLRGNLAVHAQLQATPPTVTTALAASADFTTAVELALLPIWVPPPIPQSFSLSDVVSLHASISASLSVALPNLLSLLSASIGIYAFAYEGTSSSMGAAVTTELASTWPDGAPTSASTTALIFGAVAADSVLNLPAFLNGMTFGPGLVYTGKISLSSMSPITLGAAGQGAASLAAALAASASLSVAARLPIPSFAAMLAAQAKFYANLQAVAKVPAPSFAIAATASAAASLSANFGASISLGAVMGAFGANFFVYRYTGPANAMGAAITAALAATWGDGVTPTSGPCVAAILGATDSLAIAAMLAFFGGA